MAGITLTLETLNPADYVAGVHPIRITAVSTEPDLEDSGVFVFHANSTEGAFPGDAFECVASFQQFQEIPLNLPDPDPENPIPYYRKSVVEFYLTNPAEVDEIWAIVQEDVKFLIESARLLATVGESTSVTILP